ncbi:MAG: hypothetical protein GXY85_10205 [Candidatus Brocadiaceae bacterium]|nr:hypothetical protein [Candidatus Brocadiaceae bacterium]
MVAEFFRELVANVDWSAAVVLGGVLLAAVCFMVLQMVQKAQLRRRLAELERHLADRMDAQAQAAAEAALAADGRARDALREAGSIQRRMVEVEGRIPSLQEKLEHFRRTLACIFQNELGAVLSSFDSSVTAVLEHMKADLHMGVARIETIEEMVHSRQKAGRALLGDGTGLQLVDGQKVDVECETREPSEVISESDLLAELETIDTDDGADEQSQAA